MQGLVLDSSGPCTVAFKVYCACIKGIVTNEMSSVYGALVTAA
jgi:hypothetical protein